jgi:predicted TIM-barrel fold metal-dependent hydrolase
MWGEMFGSAAARIARVTDSMMRRLNNTQIIADDLVTDAMDITEENIWHVKGSRAPSAVDLTRRPAVLDLMGIERQLIFPSFILVAFFLVEGHLGADLDLEPNEARTLGEAGIEEYNNWAVKAARIDPRLRPVLYIPQTESPEALISYVRPFLDQGIRAVHLNTGYPPAGRSPAHSDLDPFWDLLAQRNVTCTVHVGGEKGFLSSTEWAKAAAFKPGKVESIEIGLEPFSFATMSFPYSNWLAAMTLGGVFERHPTLRFGAIEVGSAWFGPFVEQLDMWARDAYATRLKPFISRLPSEYMATNVRVTPFNMFERVGDYLRQYPHLQDCYCYSTDYPHIEGAAESKYRLYEQVAPLGPEMVQKYFIDNGRLLLPQ